MRLEDTVWRGDSVRPRCRIRRATLSLRHKFKFLNPSTFRTSKTPHSLNSLLYSTFGTSYKLQCRRQTRTGNNIKQVNRSVRDFTSANNIQSVTVFIAYGGALWSSGYSPAWVWPIKRRDVAACLPNTELAIPSIYCLKVDTSSEYYWRSGNPLKVDTTWPADHSFRFYTSNPSPKLPAQTHRLPQTETERENERQWAGTRSLDAPIEGWMATGTFLARWQSLSPKRDRSSYNLVITLTCAIPAPDFSFTQQLVQRKEMSTLCAVKT